MTPIPTMTSATEGSWTVNTELTQPAVQAADKLALMLNQEQNPVLFLTAGGSSLTILEHLSVPADTDLTVGVLDERITTNRQARNTHQLQQTNFGQNALQDNGVEFIDILQDHPTDTQAVSDQFAHKLTDWYTNNPGGRIIATVGIGTDGHIAGILPDEPGVFDDRFRSHVPVFGYGLPDDAEFAGRVTTTMDWFADQLDQAYVFAVGEQKCPVLDKLIQAKKPYHEMPAQVLKSVDVDLFTDCSLSAIA